MWSFINSCLQGLVNLLGYVVKVICLILPKSPFTLLYENDAIKDYLGYITFFVPVNFMVLATELWLTAIGIYYIYQAVLRWGKVIE